METDEWIVIGAMIFVALVGVFLVRLSLSRLTSGSLYVVLFAILLILGALGAIFYGLYENKEPIWWIIPTGVIGFLVIFLILFIFFKRRTEFENSGTMSDIGGDDLVSFAEAAQAKAMNEEIIYLEFVDYIKKNPDKFIDERGERVEVGEDVYRDAILSGPEAGSPDDGGPPTKMYESWKAFQESSRGKRGQEETYRYAWEAAKKLKKEDPRPRFLFDSPVIKDYYNRLGEMEKGGLLPLKDRYYLVKNERGVYEPKWA